MESNMIKFEKWKSLNIDYMISVISITDEEANVKHF